MTANPNTFDYFRLARTFPFQLGKVDTTGFDYFRLGRIYSAVLIVTVTASGHFILWSS